MIRGLYTAATGMIHQRQRLEVIANNMSNITTPGYKRDDVASRSFQDELILRIEKDETGRVKEVGPLNHGVYVEQVVTSFRDGVINESDETTHMAIQGEGFFTVLTGQGQRYTRDGSFHIDQNGLLVTSEGLPVIGQAGQPIYIGSEPFKVDREGNIVVGGSIINRLHLVNFADLSTLEKVGYNLFENTNPDNEITDFDGEVFQGYLETSNADPMDEMTNMMAAARGYESSQKIVQMMDEILGKAVNEVGRI